MCSECGQLNRPCFLLREQGRSPSISALQREIEVTRTVSVVPYLAPTRRAVSVKEKGAAPNVFRSTGVAPRQGIEPRVLGGSQLRTVLLLSCLGSTTWPDYVMENCDAPMRPVGPLACLQLSTSNCVGALPPCLHKKVGLCPGNLLGASECWRPFCGLAAHSFELRHGPLALDRHQGQWPALSGSDSVKDNCWALLY